MATFKQRKGLVLCLRVKNKNVYIVNIKNGQSALTVGSKTEIVGNNLPMVEVLAKLSEMA